MTDPFEQAFQSFRKKQTTLQDWDESAVEDIGVPPSTSHPKGSWKRFTQTVEQMLPEAEKIREGWEVGVDKVPKLMGLGPSDFHVMTLPSGGSKQYGKRGSKQYTGLSPTERFEGQKKRAIEEHGSISAATDKKLFSGGGGMEEIDSTHHMFAPISHVLAVLLHRGMPEHRAIQKISNALSEAHERGHNPRRGESPELRELTDNLLTTHVPVGHANTTGPVVAGMYFQTLGDSDEQYGVPHRDNPERTYPVIGGLGLSRLLTGTILHPLGYDAMGSTSRSPFSEAQVQGVATALAHQERAESERADPMEMSPTKRRLALAMQRRKDQLAGTRAGKRLGIKERTPYDKFQQMMWQGMVSGESDDLERSNTEHGRAEGSNTRQLFLRPGPKFGVDKKTWEEAGWGDLRPAYGAHHHLPKFERDDPSDEKSATMGFRRRYGNADNMSLIDIPYDIRERRIDRGEESPHHLSTVIDGQEVHIGAPWAARPGTPSGQQDEQDFDAWQQHLSEDQRLPSDYLWQTAIGDWEEGGSLNPSRARGSHHWQAELENRLFDDDGNLKLSDPMEIAYRLLKSIMDLGDDDVSTQPEQPLQAPAEVEQQQRLALGIVGSREFDDLERFDDKIAEWIELHGMPTHVVSGGAQGADTMAAQWADDNGIPLIIHKPNYRLHGRDATFVRNKKIVDSSDHILAFPSINGGGTHNTIQHALRAKKPVHMHYIEHPSDDPLTLAKPFEESGRPESTYRDAWLTEPEEEREKTPEPPANPRRSNRRQTGPARGTPRRRDDNVETGEPMDLAYRLLKDDYGYDNPITGERTVVPDHIGYILGRIDADTHFQHRSDAEDDNCCAQAKREFVELAEDERFSSFLGGSHSPNEQYMECSEFEQYLEDEIKGMEDMADIPMVMEAVHGMEDILQRWRECDDRAQPASTDPTFTAGEPMDITWRMLKDISNPALHQEWRNECPQCGSTAINPFLFHYQCMSCGERWSR